MNMEVLYGGEGMEVYYHNTCIIKPHNLNPLHPYPIGSYP